MQNIDKIKTNGVTYAVRDANTYRSLSSAQATSLLSTGTYNGEEVTSGEIFTCADGVLKKYEKIVNPYGTDDFITTGSPVITDGVLSGINSSNYITSDYTFSPAASDSWEIETETTYTYNSLNQNLISDNSNKNIFLGIENGGTRFIATISQDGNDFDFTNYIVNDMYVSTGKTYRVKYSFDGVNTYTLSVSDDGGETWTTNTTTTSPVVTGRPICFGKQNSNSNTNINLKNTRVLINGVEVWRPLTASTTRSLKVLSGTKLSDIADAGNGIKILPPYNFEIVGNPTLVDKVLSNITSNDYLKFVRPSETFSVGSGSWKVKAKIRTPSNVATEATFFNNLTDQVGFRVGITVDGKWQFLVSNNGWIDTSSYYGTYSVQPDTDYWIEFGCDGDGYHEYYLKYSTDDTNYTKDISYFSSIGMMNTGVYLLGDWAGLVYLEDVSIEKGGSVWTTPYSDSTKDKIAVDILTPSSAPDSSLDGFAGQIAIYNGNAYICVDSSNTWKQFTS